MNELRRTKQKLAIFEIEGSHAMVIDALRQFDKTALGTEMSNEEYLFYIGELKKKYKEYIKENEGGDSVQGKLEI
jgi:hypothetical protein